MQGAVPGRSNVNKTNADIAADLRRRLVGPLFWGLPTLGLGLLGGAACFAARHLIPEPSTGIFGSVAGALLVFSGLAGFGLALFQRARWKRALALIAVAEELGLSFQEIADPRLYEGFKRLEMFSASSHIKAANVLCGEVEGLTILVMDCLMSAGEGGNVATFENTLFVLCDVPQRIPRFFLAPRDFLSQILLGKPRLIEVKLPQQSTFNKRFLLQGADDEAIVETFSAPLIDLCLASSHQAIEALPPLLVLQQRGKRLSPARYRDFIRQGVRLAKTLGISAAM
jgi:hypothetical protein